MKIHNINSFNIDVQQSDIKLIEGLVLRAKVVDIVDNDVLLDLGNGSFLSGKAELDLQNLKDCMINFLIKSLDSNKIELKPLLNTISDTNDEKTTMNNKKVFIDEILSLYKIEDKNTNIQTIETMIKFRMPLSKESVLNAIKYINKFESLINVNDNETLYLLDLNQQPLDCDICKFVKNKEYQTILSQDVFGADIINDKNMVNQILSQIKDFVPQNKITTEMIKKIIFLIKSDISVSINNIKLLTNLIDKGNLFEENITQIFNELFNDDLANRKVIQDIKNRIDSINITFSEQDKNNVNNYYNELKSVVELINKQVLTKKDILQELSEKIKEVNDSFNMINKLNENNTFFYLPFTLKDDIIKNNFYLLSKKKNPKATDRISIFIRLSTKNLKEIEVMCIFMNNSINLNFIVEKEFLKLFDEKKKELNNALNAIGYNNVSIYMNQHKSTDILDLLSNDEYLSYKLNIKV